MAASRDQQKSESCTMSEETSKPAVGDRTGTSIAEDGEDPRRRRADMPSTSLLQKLKKIRRTSWAVAAILTIAVFGIVGWQMANRYLTGSNHSVGTALVKSDFSLIDHNGRRVTQNTYAGRWQLVFFGFTYCPDICPTTLASMGRVIDHLGDDGDQVAALFITVDPLRDTPKILSEYVNAIHPKVIGLTGTAKEIRAAAHAFRVYYSKVEKQDAPGGYLMNHSGYIYLMTPTGAYEAVFTEKSDAPEKIAAALKKRLRGN
jgi:protein SCO1/2